MEYRIGQLVYSKSGRDSGKLMVIIAVEDTYIFLADGKLRKIENPKKKKKIHTQITNFVSENFRKKIESNTLIMNSDIRSAIKEFTEKQ